MKWAIRIGLTILVVSQAMGGMIIANGLQAVNAAGDFQADGLATASILGKAGALKVPHAWTLHAAQVLPAVAWLLAFTSRAERQRLRIVLLAAAGYVSLTLVSFLQTFSERATYDLTALTMVLAVLGLALLAASVVSTTLALARPNSGLKSPKNRDV
jgi:predicted Zn-dependent protease